MITFNGIYFRDYFSVIRDVKRPLIPEQEITTVEIPKRAGALLVNRKDGIRVITAKVQTYENDLEALQAKFKAVKPHLIVDNPAALQLDDEPGITYYAMISGNTDIEQLHAIGENEITFVCFDPYGYGETETKTNIFRTELKQDFTGKVAASTVENPHIFKRTSTSNGQSLLAPSAFTYEDPAYADLMTLGGGLRTSGRTGVGHMEQHLMSFDLIAAVERRFGVIQAADKVGWLKENIKKLTANWHGKGTNKMSNPNGKADFAGKVAGSLTANPHLFRYRNGTTMPDPSTSTEAGQGSYDLIKVLDGSSTFAGGTSASGGITQHIFSFNLIEYVKRKYGYTPSVQWLKDNISKLSLGVWCRGSGPSGNNAFINFWRGDTSAWYASPRNHTGTSITKLVMDTTATSVFITADGFLHGIVYAEASNGTIASTIETDFVELEVELKPGANKATLRNFSFISNQWGTGASVESDIITKVTAGSSNVGSYIDSSGFCAFLAHAEPSNGIVPSTIETDYIELLIELDAVHAPAPIEIDGSKETYPEYKFTLKKPTTAIAVRKGEERLLVGIPENVEMSTVNPKSLFLHDPCDSLSGWTTATAGVDGGVISGTMAIQNGSSFYPSSYGSGTSWHGPAIHRTLSKGLQDFEVEIELTQNNAYRDRVGRIEIYLTDDVNHVIAKLAMKDISVEFSNNHGEVRLGTLTGGPYILSRDSKEDGYWNNFYGGKMVIRREGKKFSGRVARVDSEGREFNIGYFEFYDAKGEFMELFHRIRVHIGVVGTRGATTQTVDDIKIYELNQVSEVTIPYIGVAGDVREVNMSDGNVWKNGHPFNGPLNKLSDFIPLNPGLNEVEIIPNGVADVELTYRTRWL